MMMTAVIMQFLFYDNWKRRNQHTFRNNAVLITQLVKTRAQIRVMQITQPLL